MTQTAGAMREAMWQFRYDISRQIMDYVSERGGKVRFTREVVLPTMRDAVVKEIEVDDDFLYFRYDKAESYYERADLFKFDDIYCILINLEIEEAQQKDKEATND